MPKDIYYKIMEDLPIRSLLNFCQTNQYIRELCKNDYFWKRRFEKHIGYGKFKPSNMSWRNYYLYLLSQEMSSKGLFAPRYIKQPLINFLLNADFGKYTDEIRLTLKTPLEKRILTTNLAVNLYVIWFKLNRNEKTRRAKADENMNIYLNEAISVLESRGKDKNKLTYTSSMDLFGPYFITSSELTPEKRDELNTEENRIMLDNARTIIYTIKQKIN